MHDSPYSLIPTLHSVDVTPFLDLMLSVSRKRSVEGILACARRAYKGTHVAFGGLWLVEGLPISGPTSDTPGAHHRLKCMVHSGTPQLGLSQWFHAEGNYELVPFTDPIFGAATHEEPVWTSDATGWDRPDWAIKEGFEAYCLYPVRHAGKFLGVMAVFYDAPMIGKRADLQSMHRKMHKIFADSLGAAFANVQAFDEIQTLRRELELENEHLRRVVRTAHADDNIVGDSGALGHVMEQIEVVAPTDATVLLLGESGTGKELLAQAIHQRSERRAAPLVRVNCSAIPRELFESEFFGHVKGSFTGAVRDRTGRFQLADGGTLFLDEIGEIPLELQGKLLRVLQEGIFEPIGDDRSRRVDVRIVAATNRDLGAEVRAGNFRQDLYYRLSVFPIINPPLRDRKEDIPLLAKHFITGTAKRLGIEEPRLHYRHLRDLQHYAWPGNVRELQNAIERAVIMAHGGVLEFNLPQGIPHSQMPSHPTSSFPHEQGTPVQDNVLTEAQLTQIQRENTLKALNICHWKVQGEGGAAELLGIKPTTLQSRIRKYKLIKPR